MAPQIRRATALDSELLARLGRETFPGNFVGMDEPVGMAPYMAEHFTPERIAEELAEPGMTVFIVYADGEPAGYARLRNGTTPACVTELPTAEIQRMYVVQRHWRGGYGRALIEACVDEAVQRSCRSVWLATWSENERAIGFYRALGFEDVGTQYFQLGPDRHLDLVMRRLLSSD